MRLKFDINNVKATEFGIGRNTGGSTGFGKVAVDKNVSLVLSSMAQQTLKQLNDDNDYPPEYEPAEKYCSTEYLTVNSSSSFGALIRNLHEAENLPDDNTGLSRPESIVCYFARFVDDNGRRLTAVKRAIQFKGVLKRKLVRFIDNTLEIVEDDVFKLDSDFDVLLDSASTHIWRPSAFESLGQLNQAILDAAPNNIKEIAGDLPFIDFTEIAEYAKSRPRAARYIASIRSQSLQGIDQMALVTLCKDTGVDIQDVNGYVTVSTGNEMAFLEILDRRLYKLELLPNQPERFRAASRVRIDSAGAKSSASKSK